MNDERRRDYPEILKQLEDISSDIKSIRHILNGNGKPGLCAIVDEDHNFLNGVRKTGWWIITSVVLGGIITFMFVAFNHAVGL